MPHDPRHPAGENVVAFPGPPPRIGTRVLAVAIVFGRTTVALARLALRAGYFVLATLGLLVLLRTLFGS